MFRMKLEHLWCIVVFESGEIGFLNFFFPQREIRKF